MKGTFKVICSLLIGIMLLAMMATGCSNQQAAQDQTTTIAKDETTAAASEKTQETGIDTSKEVNLKLYLIGDTPPDLNLVYDEVNKKLKNDINATVEPNLLSWGDWSTKYPLIMASGEDYDLIYAALWCDYVNNARKGAFLELTDELLNKYAPLTIEKTPKIILDASRVDGKLYHIPQSYNEFFVAGLLVRGDLMKKYGIESIKTIEDWEAYMDAVAKNEKGIIPFNAGTNMDYWIPYEFCMSQKNDWTTVKHLEVLSMKKDDSAVNLTFLPDNPDYIAFVKKMRTWYEKGYWSKNVLTNNFTSKDTFKEGKSACAAVNLLQANEQYIAVNAQHPEWDVKFFQLYPDGIQDVREYGNNGIAINAKSKNPERALMMLDLFRNNKEYFNLSTYGIQGKHYNLTADGKLDVIKDNTGYPPDLACPWGWRTEENYLTYANSLPNFNDVRENLKNHVKPYPLKGFVFNDENYKGVTPILNDIRAQYIYPLEWGLVADVDKQLNMLKDKLKDAKVNDELFQEYKRQALEFVKTHSN